AAYENWVAFFNDREWEAVLDKPEFQSLLTQRPESTFLTENDYSALKRVAIDQPGGVYELRTYVTAPGKLAALNARFRDHTGRLFEKHGMKNVGYWTPFDRPESANTLVYLLHHTSRQQADANWKAFGADPGWHRVRQESEVDGKLLTEPPERIYLKALGFSPLK
ncbi:MAG: NIPSNAP family protein, partial [Roseibacillus sp.]|nr:NIPSNAP family protein [Roseibacillus sp.]